MDNISEEIFKTFALKSSKSLNIPYQLLYNGENSFKNFCSDLNKFLKIDEVIHIKKGVKNISEVIKLVTCNFNITIPIKDYRICVLEGKPFNMLVTFDEIFISEKVNQEGTITEEPIENSKKTIEVLIPIFIGYKGNIPFPGSIINDNEIGGYFRHNHGIRKHMTHMFSPISSWPKYKSDKNLCHHFSFQSVCSRFNKITMPQYLTIDLKIDITNSIYEFIINCKNSFISLDVILLIHYLTNFTIKKIKSLLLLDFVDNTISRNVNIMCYNSKLLLDENYKDKKVSKIENYINNQIDVNLKEKPKDKKNYKTIILNNFLPHLREREQIDKGMFLIIKLRQMLVASFQNKVYPDKDNLMTKKVMPIGSQLENIIVEDRESYISECKNLIAKKSLDEFLKSVSKFHKTTNIINNTFNNQNKKWSQSIKVETISNNQNQSIIIGNRIVYPRSLKLNKSLEMRNVHPSTNGWLDPSNTTDHGPNVGLVKSFNTGTKVTHYTIETNRRIFKEIENYIISKTKDYTDINNGVMISIVDNSEYYINSIQKDKVNDFINQLKKKKRENYFSTYDFGVVLIPMHTFDKKSKIYYPLDNNFLQIRITLGIERIVRPLLVVENGKIIGNDYINEIDDESLSDFNIFMKKHPHVVEFVDVEQSIYSNICSSIKEFNTMKDNSKINYIEFPPLSKVSFLTSYLTDISRIAGARVTLGDAQQKHTLSGLSKDNFNKFDNCLNLSLPFEMPCISNNTLQMSGLTEYGFGSSVLTAAMSWGSKNLEDSIILSKKCYDSGVLGVIITNKFSAEVPSICLNSPLPSRLTYSHKKLGSTGIHKVGTIIEKDDAMYKNVKLKFESSTVSTQNNSPVDASESLKINYPVRIDRVRIEGTDNIEIKYLLTTFRYKEIGDKITNQAAQKGTIGCILQDLELPYTSKGVTPDIIVNSVSIPSRKTFNLFNQVKLTTGYCSNPLNNKYNLNLVNYPPLTETSLEEYHKKIKERYLKYNNHLSEDELDDKTSCLVNLYNPYTQKLIKCEGGYKHFMGVLYYLPLTQIAIDKITSRNKGKKNKLLQAPSGKKRQGGIRFGEMEKEGIACHGASDNIISILSDSYDNKITSFICTRCGEFACFEQYLNSSRWKCLKCEVLGYSPELQKFNFTYASKIFLQALNCRGKIIIPKIKREKLYYPN